MKTFASLLRIFAASVATRAIPVSAMFETSSCTTQCSLSGADTKSETNFHPFYPSATTVTSIAPAFLAGVIPFSGINDHTLIASQKKYHSSSFAKKRRLVTLSLLQSSSSNDGFEGFGGDDFRARDYNRSPNPPFGSESLTGKSRNNQEFVRKLISKTFGSDNSTRSQFVPLSLAGRWTQTLNHMQAKGSINQRSVDVLFLALPEKCKAISKHYEDYLSISINQEDYEKNGIVDSPSIPALPLPLSTSTSPISIRLLSHTYSSKPLSKSTILSLNALFLRRDGGLFDNIPWSTWSIDPDKKERDAADNVVEGKYTLGKRVAYQRLMGKDWEGRSLSLGNIAKRIRYVLEREEKGDDTKINDVFEDLLLSAEKVTSEEDMMFSLSRRLLELEIKEAEMEVAECEQQVAISRAAQASDETFSTMDLDLDNISGNEYIKSLENARLRLQSAKSSLRELSSAVQQKAGDGNSSPSSAFPFSFPWEEKTDTGNTSQTSSLLFAILDKMAEQKNPPPYRGAIGYPAKLDTKEEMFEQSVLPYTSPYELLLDIIDDQLNSKVIGCVLEQTSLFEGNLVLGGALLLQRKGITKSVSIAGEAVSYTDDDDDYGNEGVYPQSTYVVECYSDEAIGIAMTSGLPVYVEQNTWERAGQVFVEIDPSAATQSKKDAVASENRVNIMNRIPFMKPVDGFEFSSQVEGEKVSSEQDSNMIRIPLTTNPQVFEDSDLPQSSTANSNRSVFSTFNPVRSLDEYDSLSDDEKARILLKLESFRGELPRPRAVRASVKERSDQGYEDGSPPSLLDDILVPLIDESVRRQFLIRDAERRKDYKEAKALRESSSPRQKALEEAQLAREEGREDEALKFEEEAESYKNLRADITQDEGAYSRFLDRDDWYERETQARIKRLDKSKFGSLLDGMD